MLLVLLVLSNNQRPVICDSDNSYIFHNKWRINPNRRSTKQRKMIYIEYREVYNLYDVASYL